MGNWEDITIISICSKTRATQNVKYRLTELKGVIIDNSIYVAEEVSTSLSKIDRIADKKNNLLRVKEKIDSSM